VTIVFRDKGVQKSISATIAVIGLAVVSGCGTAAQPGVELFFCGCPPCAELADELAPSMTASTKVFYRGSIGDAEGFKRRHALSCRVAADLDGATSRAKGVDTCPSIVVPEKDGAKVLGNGQPLSDGQRSSIKLMLQRDQ
jgi:hypothetical protein